jgi:hypothetical protein
MGNFWKSSMRDNAKNGTILGLFLGICIIFGVQIYGFIVSIFPHASPLALKAGILVVALIIGYIIDKW